MTPDESLAPPPAPLAETAPAHYAAVAYDSSELRAYATRVKVAGICFAVLAACYIIALLFFASVVSSTHVGGPAPAGSRAAEESSAQLAGGMVMLAAIINATKIGGAILCSIAAFSLLAKAPWGRLVTIIVSIPLLILFPFGTVLAAYAIYLMVKTGSSEKWALLTAKV